MKIRMRGEVAILALVALGGCATLPSGPSVLVLPAPGKPFSQFQAEDATCRRFAETRLGIRPQEAASQNAVGGAAVGTAVGAAAGALLGAASGHAGAGAAIGAGSGLLLGTAVGSDAGEVSGYRAQRRYDHAYLQCMYAYGNQIPGVRREGYGSREAVAPPPPPGYEGSPAGSEPPIYPPPNEPPPPGLR